MLLIAESANTLNIMPILPQRLHLGDTLGLISPASAPPDPQVIDDAIAAVEKMGFKVKLGRHARKRWGFLAGKDPERAADVMQMFNDPKVHAIVCIRGGYGSGRLLPLLDYGAIRKNPKVFVGFSDITSLHCAFLKKSNLLSFHGPTAGNFCQADYPEFSRQSWLRTLTQPVAVRSICDGYDGDTVSILRRGKVAGELIGGNLSLLVTTIGTPFQPSFRGKILFLEDVDEKPYRLDRLLTHLLNAGLLQQVAGIAVGICNECLDPKAKDAGEFRQTSQDVFHERLRPLNVPVVTGLPFGHVRHNATLPFGGRTLLDANRGDLIITHAAVS
jgi:muramoyltetrapeptide carboxypeptidase